MIDQGIYRKTPQADTRPLIFDLLNNPMVGSRFPDVKLPDTSIKLSREQKDLLEEAYKIFTSEETPGANRGEFVAMLCQHYITGALNNPQHGPQTEPPEPPMTLPPALQSR